MTDTLPQLRDDDRARLCRSSACSRRRRRSGRMSSPTFTIEVDGKQFTGREGQTILEICRDNGIDVPTLCYEPKLPGFGACRMCVVEVDGEDTPPISCSRAAEPDMVVQTQTAAPARDPQDEPGADLQRPQRLLPAAVPEQVPQPHRHPGLPEGQHGRQLHRVGAHLQAHHPLPQRARPRLPGAVRGALPARRGRGGDRHPRHAPLRRRPGAQGARPQPAQRRPCRSRSRPPIGQARGGHRLRPGGHGRGLLPGSSPATM